MDAEQIRRIVEAALLAADEPLGIGRLTRLFAPGELPEDDPRAAIRAALDALQADTPQRGCELAKVASGYRFQIRQDCAPWVARLFEQRPPRYSRALLETLALIVYRQPATRGDIEAARGVAVSSSIMRTLLERGWIRAVGQREAPGRPTLYGTTPAFLDYFNLASLDELPPMAQIQELVDAQAAAEAAPDVPDVEETPESSTENDARPLAEVVHLPIANRSSRSDSAAAEDVENAERTQDDTGDGQ